MPTPAICRTAEGETSRVHCANGPSVFNGPSVTNNPVKIADGSSIVALYFDRALGHGVSEPLLALDAFCAFIILANL